jgi:hypothetical protein
MAGEGQPLTETGKLSVTYQLGVNGFPTQTSKDIFDLLGSSGTHHQELLQEWILHFMEKQRDYGDTADDLGVPGQYAELHRKLGKLKRCMWEGIPMQGEQPDEILLDLIGHCFLAIRHLRQNNYGGKLTR